MSTQIVTVNKPTVQAVKVAQQVVIGGGSGGGTSWTITEAQTGALSSGDMWLVDSASARTRDLPATPATDDEVIIKDDTGSAAANNATIGRNGSTILGAAADFTLNINYGMVRLKYNGTTWKVVS